MDGLLLLVFGEVDKKLNVGWIISTLNRREIVKTIQSGIAGLNAFFFFFSYVINVKKLKISNVTSRACFPMLTFKFKSTAVPAVRSNYRISDSRFDPEPGISIGNDIHSDCIPTLVVFFHLRILAEFAITNRNKKKKMKRNDRTS